MWNNTPRPLTWGKGGRLYWKIYPPGISWAIGSWYGWLKQKGRGNLLGCSERGRPRLGAVICIVDFFLRFLKACFPLFPIGMGWCQEESKVNDPYHCSQVTSVPFWATQKIPTNLLLKSAIPWPVGEFHFSLLYPLKWIIIIIINNVYIIY